MDPFPLVTFLGCKIRSKFIRRRSELHGWLINFIGHHVYHCKAVRYVEYHTLERLRSVRPVPSCCQRLLLSGAQKSSCFFLLPSRAKLSCTRARGKSMGRRMEGAVDSGRRTILSSLPRSWVHHSEERTAFFCAALEPAPALGVGNAGEETA